MSDNRPSVYQEDGNIIVRASSLMKCPLSLAKIFLGEQEIHNYETLKKFREGTRLEDVIIDHLKATGNEVNDTQLEVTVPINGVYIRGHIDGKIGDSLLEVKTASDSSWRKVMLEGIECCPGYCHQGLMYLIGTGLQQITWVFYNKDYKESVGTEERLLFIHRTLSDLIINLPVISGKIERFLKTVVELSEGKNILCDEFNDFPFHCPFEKYHNDGVKNIHDSKYEVLLDEYNEISNQEKIMVERKKELKKLLDNLWKHHGGGKQKINRHTVSWARGREYFDFDSFMIDMGISKEITKQYMKEGAGHLRIYSKEN